MKREEKVELARRIGEELKKYKTLVFFDLYKVTTREFKEIRKKIEERGKVIVLKKSTLFYSLKNAGIKDDFLKELDLKQFGIILSNEEPFSLFKFISSVCSERYPKEGDIVEKDVWVYAGPTQIKAGPSISEFARLKIPAGVEGGFIAVKKDTQVLKSGDKISKELASLLRKLKIKPINVRLNVISILHENKLYKKDILNLVFEYPEIIKRAYQNALNLSVNINYPTKENINILISKAYLNAMAIKNLVV